MRTLVTPTCREGAPEGHSLVAEMKVCQLSMDTSILDDYTTFIYRNTLVTWGHLQGDGTGWPLKAPAGTGWHLLRCLPSFII